MRRLALVLALLVGLPLVLGLLIKRVPPAFIGVKQISVGGAGIVSVDYPTGFHLGVTGYHKWYFLPRKTHFLHFTASRSLKGTVRVLAAVPAGTPGEFGMPRVSNPLPALTSRESECPW